MRYLSAAGRCAVGLRDGLGEGEAVSQAGAGAERPHHRRAAPRFASPLPAALRLQGACLGLAAGGIATPRYLRSVPGARRDACRRGAGKVGSGHGPWPSAPLVGLRAGAAPAAAAALRTRGSRRGRVCRVAPSHPCRVPARRRGLRISSSLLITRGAGRGNRPHVRERLLRVAPFLSCQGSSNQV